MNVELEAEVHMKRIAKRLSDEVLMERLGRLVGSGRRITARVIVYLAEVKSRKLHLRQAYASLTDFCRRRLGMSEGEAYRRVVAATLVLRFPIIRRLVSRGHITLTTLVLLRDHLTDDNHRTLLRDASRKSKMDVLRLIAERFPRPDVEQSVRPAGEASHVHTAAHEPTAAVAAETDWVTSPTAVEATIPGLPIAFSPTTTTFSTTSSATGHIVEPLSSKRCRLELTISDTLLECIERTLRLMSHRNPTQSLERAMEYAFGLALEKLERERLGKAKRKANRAAASQERFAAMGAPPASFVATNAGFDTPTSSEETFVSARESGLKDDALTVCVSMDDDLTQREVSSEHEKVAFSVDRDTELSLHPWFDVSEPPLFEAVGVDALCDDARPNALATMQSDAHDAPSVVTLNTNRLLSMMAGSSETDVTQAAAPTDANVPTGAAPPTEANTRTETVTNAADKDTSLSDGSVVGDLQSGDDDGAQRNDAPIPRPARRAAFERDGERCSYVSADGKRCPARSWLEVDHISPRARGGSNHVTNLRVLCRAHNQLLAEDTFGRRRVVAGQRRRKGMQMTPSSSRVERESRPSTTRDDFDTAQRALKTMGFKDTETRRAVATLRSQHVNRAAPQLEQILRDALGLLTGPGDRHTPLS